ncbi:MAG: AI-2E family transporter [Gloeomargarita sp. GXS_bins_116]
MPPKLTNDRLLRYLLLLALGWAIWQIFNYLAPVLVIFILAGIIAFLLHYPVEYVRRWLTKALAVTLVTTISGLLLLALLLTIGFTVLAQAQDVLNRSDEIINSILNLLDEAEKLLARLRLSVDLGLVEKAIKDNLLTLTSWVLTAIQKLAYSLLYFIVIIIIALFMLFEGAKVWWFLVSFVPEPWRSRLTPAVQKNLIGFFWGRFVLSCFFGASVFVVFWLMRLEQALFLAVIAGLFDLIPGVGATIGVTLVALIVLPQGPLLSLLVILVCVVMQQIEENLLLPKVMKDSLNINPVVMFFALLIGARAAGLIGVFLSIPIAGVLVSLLDLEALKSGSAADQNRRLPPP